MRKVDGKKFQYEFAIPNLTNAEALAFAAQLPAVKALVWTLEQVQWVDYRDEDVCPVCGSIPKEGHTEECIIATALAPFTEAE